MMNSAHGNQIEILFFVAGGFLTLLFALIVFAFIKQLRKSQAEEEERQALLDRTNLTELSASEPLPKKTDKTTEPSLVLRDASGESESLHKQKQTDSSGQTISKKNEITDLEKKSDVLSSKTVSKDEISAETRSSVSSDKWGLALKKTRGGFVDRIKGFFSSSALPEEILNQIEETLYTADLGPQTVERLLAEVQKKLKISNSLTQSSSSVFMTEVILALKTEVAKILSLSSEGSLLAPKDSPLVIMVVGVNGAGKTTSIGKLAKYFSLQGLKVIVAAGDTFRAAAGSQLETWSERAKVDIFSLPGVTDPSAVAFEALNKAKAHGYQVIIVDTAGRLHNQPHLMEEIKKMKRVMAKVIPEAPHEVLIVLDANSGQNALMQAKEFNKELGLTGAILTKLDGTAKGGIGISLASEVQVPIKFVGLGEGIDDIQPFDKEKYIEGLFAD